jgi:endoglucanase
VVTRRTTITWTAALAVAAAAGVSLVLGTPRFASSRTADPTAAERFLSRYLAADGRVVRSDQGGDTVSEGQAYAMLLTAASGDDARFRRVWNWTRTHLQRRDGLLSYRWRRGAIADRQPATDADLDAARALLIAGQRFNDPRLRRAGVRIGKAILARETMPSALGPVLVAGPWAAEQHTVNPSYFSPAAFQELARSTGDPRWSQLEFTSYQITDALTAAAPNVPPDWATVDTSGHAVPRDAPAGGAPRFGFEALRVPIRMAGAGTDYGRGLAARIWHFFSALPPATIAPTYRLDGQPAQQGQHAAMLAAAAASGAAAGEVVRGQELMDRASAVDLSAPTYYGAAWLALSQMEIARGASR